VKDLVGGGASQSPSTRSLNLTRFKHGPCPENY